MDQGKATGSPTTEIVTPAPDALNYVLENYGACDRDHGKWNDCYWGKDAAGRENGCLKTGWKGRNCKHWHPVDGETLAILLAIHHHLAASSSSGPLMTDDSSRKDSGEVNQ